jgi:hypothetical protein
MIALALLLGLAAADPLEDAVRAELDRAKTGLALPEAPPVYHLRYHLMMLDQVDAHAAFGALVESGDAPWNGVGVEVRVGTPAFDNSNFGGWQTGFSSAGIGRTATSRSTGLATWRMTDAAYKEAVEQYARKQAQFQAPPDYPGDYTLVGEGARFEAEIPRVGDRAALEAIARALSARMTVDPRVSRADAWVGHEAGRHLILDTEGADVTRPVAETTLRAAVHLRLDDGQLLTDQRLWTVRTLADLPPLAEMEAEVEGMARALVAVADAPSLEDEYVGPVLLRGTAATDLFRWLLAPQLEGTPGEIPFDTWLGDLGSASDPVRVGRRVLPDGWSVVDDPTAHPEHPAAFTHDTEGTPAQRVEVVEDGIVRAVLMSRTPRTGVSASNGHARNLPGSRMVAHVADWTVSPPRHQSERKLLKRALKEAAGYGRDWVIVIDRLQEPSVRQGGGMSFSFGADEAPALPAPVSVKRVYADGREEVLRGAAFASVARFVLRDIVAAGPSVEASYMLSGSGYHGWLGPTEGFPTRIEAPSVLIGEMELVPSPGDPREAPTLPAPPLPARAAVAP